MNKILENLKRILSPTPGCTDNHEQIYDVFDLNYEGDFDRSLSIEKECQPFADDFYSKTLENVKIKRYDYNNPKEKVYQTHDIDCKLTPYAPGIGEFDLYVSEKFRLNDWGDMFIELWSDFEGEKLGWADASTDNNLKPDVYMYFTPISIYEIWNHIDFRRLVNKLHKVIDRDRIKYILRTDKDLKVADDYPYMKDIDFEGTKIKLIKTHSYRDGRGWNGIGVCINWKDLIEKFGVNVVKWQKKEGKFKKVNICN